MLTRPLPADGFRAKDSRRAPVAKRGIPDPEARGAGFISPGLIKGAFAALPWPVASNL